MRLVFLKKTAWALFAGAAACAFAGAQTQPPAQQQKPQTNQSESEQKAKRIEQARVWETYIQAAGQSIIADDQVSAEIFLNAAMDLARPMGPRNLRLFVTGKMLGLVYQDQGNNDAWEKVHGETPEISRPNFGKEFLPVATILDRVV